MMQSAPISRAAATVFNRCCATSVSTVGHAGDVDDRDLGAGGDDLFEQALHHDLRARAVERADQRQRQNALPELDDRRGEFEQLLLLAGDDFLAAALVHLGGVQTELVEQARDGPDLRGPRRPPPRSAAISANSGCLSEKTKVAVSDGVKAERGALGRQLFENIARVGPARSRNVFQIAALDAALEGREKAARLLAEFAFADRATAEPGRAALQPQPFVEQTIAAPLDQSGNQALSPYFPSSLHYRWPVAPARVSPAARCARIVPAFLLPLQPRGIGRIISAFRLAGQCRFGA